MRQGCSEILLLTHSDTDLCRDAVFQFLPRFSYGTVEVAS